jgi:hypothetical protein
MQARPAFEALVFIYGQDTCDSNCLIQAQIRTSKTLMAPLLIYGPRNCLVYLRIAALPFERTCFTSCELLGIKKGPRNYLGP